MDSKYEIIVYWSKEDDYFVAEVPELAGCMANGDTYVEAIQNAQVVMQHWVETAKNWAGKSLNPKGN